MNILVTGSSGFVGKETCQQLTEQGHAVFGYDIMDGNDIRDINQFEKFVVEHKIERILHLAAIARFNEADENPLAVVQTNIIGTDNVAKVADKYHIPLVYASTGSVYMPISQDPPITENFKAKGNSVYACSKYQGELIIKEFHMPYIILRYAHLYGRERRMHGLIGGFLDRIKFGLAPILYGGKQSNDFLYIKDVARANCLALTAPWDKWNQIYNIGTGEELTAEDAGKIVCELAGYTGDIETKDARTVDPLHFVYDTGKAERQLGFKAAFSFRQGLEDMFKEQTNDTTNSIEAQDVPAGTI